MNDKEILSCELPTEFKESFQPHFSSLRSDISSGPTQIGGSLADTVLQGGVNCSMSWKSCDNDDKSMILPPSRSKHILNSTALHFLSCLYGKMHSVPISNVQSPSVCWKYTSVTVQGKLLGCRNTQSQSSAV